MWRTVIVCSVASFVMAFFGSLFAIELVAPRIAAANERTSVSEDGTAATVPVTSAEAASVTTFTGTTRLNAASPPGQVLNGSWMSTVDREPLPPLVTLLTITSDGSMVQTNTSHPTEGPAHGAWIRTGERQFAIVLWRLIFDENGSFVRTQKISGTRNLNEALDELVGDSLVEEFDLQGNLVLTYTTLSSATRIKVEPN